MTTLDSNHGQTAESGSAWAEALPHLDTALQDLSATDRELILLRYYEELSYRDIGYRLGKNESTAQRQGSRAMERLQLALHRRQKASTLALTALSAGLRSLRAETPAPSDLSAGWAAQATAQAGGVSSLTATFHAWQMWTWGHGGLVAIAALAITLAAFGGSFLAGRRLLTSQSTPASPTVTSASIGSGPKPRFGPPPLVSTLSPSARALRDKLEYISHLFSLEVGKRRLTLTYSLSIDGQSISALIDMASLKKSDIEPAVSLLRFFEHDATRFDCLTVVISWLLLEHHPPEEVAPMFLRPEFRRQGLLPLVALNGVLDAWANEAPSAAWAWQKQQTQQGALPCEKRNPALTSALVRLLQKEPIQALSEIRQLPKEWRSYAKAAFMLGIDTQLLPLIQREIDATPDDVCAQILAGSQQEKIEVAKLTVPWLLKRPWQTPLGAEDALRAWIWHEGAVDVTSVALLGVALNEVKEPHGQALIRSTLAEAFSEGFAPFPDVAHSIFERYIKDPACRKLVEPMLPDRPRKKSLTTQP